jgi:crotonobetaine/carnitine-CoA ligase
MDEQGRVFHHGRIKDMIRRSGENISADEVERALQLHPLVQLVAVLARADPLRGEEVHAVVVLQGPDLSPDELIAFCQDQLAYFKVPRYWTFVDQLPMTPSERVAKAALATELAQQPTGLTYDRMTGEWQ